ncbi:hypothetical protein SAY87_023138 [Trapa incisa]|uniref:Uncharacterized protein n=1 Tax=Trapa incisa TaxID=236973 RepID=A0AAN7Q5P7_9MYRT|nr:hypothetical protein SAY87_023138 [Trapa incisa]
MAAGVQSFPTFTLAKQALSCEDTAGGTLGEPFRCSIKYFRSDSTGPHSSGLGPHIPLPEYIENMRKIGEHLKKKRRWTPIFQPCRILLSYQESAQRGDTERVREQVSLKGEQNKAGNGPIDGRRQEQDSPLTADESKKLTKFVVVSVCVLCKSATANREGPLGHQSSPGQLNSTQPRSYHGHPDHPLPPEAVGYYGARQWAPTTFAFASHFSLISISFSGRGGREPHSKQTRKVIQEETCMKSLQ